MSAAALPPDPQILAADPNLSVFVTANAGTGKTYTLVSRVARLLLARVEPASILCLTYTKAAAAEMQRRLYERLGDWSVAPDSDLRGELARLELRDPNDFPEDYVSRARSLFARALETPGGLKIQTIHGFCERLLRRFPLEAEVAPTFQVIDDMAAASLAAEAREEVAKAAMSGHEQISQAYARFAVALDFEAFEGMFKDFEARRAEIADWIAEQGGLDRMVETLLSATGLSDMEDPGEVLAAAVAPPALHATSWLAAARDLAGGSDTDKKNGLKAQALAEAATRGEAAFSEAWTLLFTNENEARKSVGGKSVDNVTKDFLRAEQDRLAAARERALANQVVADTVDALILARVYAAEYENAKARRGVLDFADLVTKAQTLMSSHPDAAWVLYKLDGGIDHILVDEAQDTAPEQWSIIRALADEFFVGEGKTVRVIDPTIFAVGDEKQSIFSFQGARPEQLRIQIHYYSALVRGALKRFEEVGLTVSRRSVQQVLSFVDATFGPAALTQAIMPRAPGAVANDNLVLAHLAHRAGEPGCVDLWPLEQEDKAEIRRAWDEPVDAGEGRGAYRRLAERIAGEIVDLVRRGDPVFDAELKAWRPAGFGDVLILVRKRGALFKELIRALKHRDAPVAGADRLALAETALFEDLLAAGRFCLFPEDDLTLAGLLRSPFCDIDETGLHDLARGRSGSLWAELLARAGERDDYAAAAGLLSDLLAESRRRTPFDLLTRLTGRLDAAGRSMRARLRTRLGPEAEDALDEMLAQVLTLEGQGLRDLESVCHALGRMTVTVKREMDEPRGQVRVMTTHGAKGLEAPIVFLPETISRSGGRASPLMEMEGGGFLWSARKDDDCKASAAARDWRARKADDETLRLLYVALTRARDRLVIAGRIAANAKQEPSTGWWGAVSAAFDQLGAEVREIQADGLVFRRYGPDPVRLTAVPALPAAVLPSPDWLTAALPVSAAARYASPSQALEEDPAEAQALSPLARSAGISRFRRGEIIHRLLQLLPDIDPPDRAAAAVALMAQERDLTDDQRAEMTAAAMSVLDDDRFAAVFGPNSRAESALAGTSPKLPPGLNVSGRMDRLVVEADRVLVVDYKTNRPAPARIEDADAAYITQMAIYAAVLGEIFPGRRIEAALVWTDGPRLMTVPENLMAAALAALMRDG